MIIKKDTTKRNKSFEKLVAYNQADLKSHLEKSLSNSGREVINKSGFLYSPGDIPIILCAHMDTVHKETPKEIVYKNGTISSPQGIGGDDRCGIYMILRIIKEYNCHVMFFEDEEDGGKGSLKFCQSHICDDLRGQIRYVIELDRKGSNDAVFYNCDNYDFEDFVTKEFWNTESGSFTDICNICPDLECAGVNLSCGYYKQHTENEYVVLSEMETAINETKKLIERSKDVDVFEYVEAVHFKKGYGNYGSSFSVFGKNYYDKYYGDEITYFVIFKDEKGKTEVYDTIATSEQEALGMCCMDHPDLAYNSVEFILTEDDYYGYYEYKYGK